MKNEQQIHTHTHTSIKPQYRQVLNTQGLIKFTPCNDNNNKQLDSHNCG